MVGLAYLEHRCWCGGAPGHVWARSTSGRVDGGSQQEQPAAGQGAVTLGAVEVRLEVPPTVVAGRPVPMRIVARNISNRPAELNVMEPQTVDFLVTTADGRFVWDLLVPETCPDRPVITLISEPVISPPLRPGGPDYQHATPQRNQCGRPGPPASTALTECSMRPSRTGRYDSVPCRSRSRLNLTAHVRPAM